MKNIFITIFLLLSVILIGCTSKVAVQNNENSCSNNDLNGQLKKYDYYRVKKKKDDLSGKYYKYQPEKAKKSEKDEYAAIDDYLFNSYDTPKNMKKEKIPLGAVIGMEAAVGVQDR
jgi:hypothetical protein